MKKILVLCGRYFPKASPNSLCLQNVLDALPKEYKVHIVAYRDGLETRSYIPVTKFSRGLVQNLIYRNEDKSSKRILSVLNIFMKLKQIPFIPLWPWTDLVTTLREWNCVKKLVKDEQFDMVISIYMPLSSLIVGHQLKKQIPEIKYFAYFLDSLAGGYVPHYMSEVYFERHARKWEKRLLSNADKIVFMESTRIHHEKIYQRTPIAEKIEYLDLPVLMPKPQHTQQNHDRIKTLLYVGSLPTNIRSPEYILKVFERLSDSSMRFIFIGEGNCSILNEYAARDTRIMVLGKLPHDEVLEYEKQADVLVNIGNRNANLTPSKIFEYMSWRKKIISTYSVDEDSSKSYLSKYPMTLLLDERDQRYERVSQQVEKFIMSQDSDISDEKLSCLFHGNTPAAMVDLITQLL